MASSKTAEGSTSHQRKRVVVVGAGISGISAARHLVRHGGFDVVVLEGRQDRYGGRIWSETDAFTDDAVVDLGASWIHGSCPLNPTTQLRDKFEVETVTTDHTNIKIWDGQTGASIGKTKLLYHSAKFLYNQRKIRGAAQRAVDDSSIHDTAKVAGLMPTLALPLQLLLRMGLWETHGASYDRISAKLMDVGVELKGTEEVFPKGYKQLLERLVEGDEKRRPLKIIYNAIVSRVAYSEDDDSVLVATDDGTEYAADCTIVTVPLGVLKAGDITFDPPLDSEREAIIDRAGFGTMNKLVFEFDKVFWDPETKFFAITPQKDSPAELMLVYWLNMHAVSGKPILVGLIVGESAVFSESLSDEDIKNVGLARLKVMFGEEALNGSKIVATIRTKWNDDPFAKGSYSFPAVDQHEDDWLSLGKPIGRLVHFAGEHTHPTFCSTVHGALASGARVANEVIGTYFPNDKSNNIEEELNEHSNSTYNCTIL